MLIPTDNVVEGLSTLARMRREAEVLQDRIDHAERVVSYEVIRVIGEHTHEVCGADAVNFVWPDGESVPRVESVLRGGDPVGEAALDVQVDASVLLPLLCRSSFDREFGEMVYQWRRS